MRIDLDIMVFEKIDACRERWINLDDKEFKVENIDILLISSADIRKGNVSDIDHETLPYSFVNNLCFPNR